VDVRILAATHRNLADEVAAGRFREDLLYRIRVARVRIPPLRERREDIPLLVSAFLDECRASSGKQVREVSAEAMRRLIDYGWPGNVRELKSSVEYAVINCRKAVIQLKDLPPEVLEAPTAGPPETAPAGDERTRLLAALDQAGGNRTRAAQILGMSRATFYRHLTKLGINPES